MSKKIVFILLNSLFFSLAFADTQGAINTEGANTINKGGGHSVTTLPNINCITRACTQGNTGGSVTIGSCNPANPTQDDAPVVNHFECLWSGTTSSWTQGTNIDAACGNGSCSPAYLEWVDVTTVKKCDGSIRTQTTDVTRCVNNGGETCTLTWSDGSTSAIPGDQAAADAGTNYVTAYAATSVPWGSTCTSQRRYCQETSPGSGVQQITGTYTAKNCTIQPPANCTAPWGSGVAHGTSVTAYQSPSVPSGSSCTSQNRGCINGNLSGTYTNQSCSVSAPPPSRRCHYAGFTTIYGSGTSGTYRDVCSSNAECAPTYSIYITSSDAICVNFAACIANGSSTETAPLLGCDLM